MKKLYIWTNAIIIAVGLTIMIVLFIKCQPADPLNRLDVILFKVNISITASVVMTAVLLGINFLIYYLLRQLMIAATGVCDVWRER